MCFLSSDTNSSPSCQFEVQFTSHLQPISAHLFFFLEIASQEADNKHVMLKKRLATKVRSARIWFGIIQFDQKCIFFFFFFYRGVSIDSWLLLQTGVLPPLLWAESLPLLPSVDGRRSGTSSRSAAFNPFRWRRRFKTTKMMITLPKMSPTMMEVGRITSTTKHFKWVHVSPI